MVPFATARVGKVLDVAEWRLFGRVLTEVTQRWWWRAAAFVLLPLYLIVTFTHVITGWPVAVLAVAWMLSLVAVWVVAIAAYRRNDPS